VGTPIDIDIIYAYMVTGTTQLLLFAKTPLIDADQISRDSYARQRRRRRLCSTSIMTMV
jgi:hypothetical protein